MKDRLLDSEEKIRKFNFIYENYRDWFFNYARKILNDDDLAEDALQISFLTISRNLHKIQDETSREALGFCMAIVRSKCHAVRAMESKHWSQSVGPVEELPENQLRTSSTDPVWHEYAMAETKVQLQRTVSRLPEVDRQLLIGHYDHNLTYDQLAKKYHFTPKNISVKISRIKARLFKKMNGGQ